MTLAIRRLQQLQLALSDARLLLGLLEMGHQVPIPVLREALVRVPSTIWPSSVFALRHPEPVTDPLRPELPIRSGKFCLNVRT